MPRLTPPRKGTFTLGLLLVAGGVAIRLLGGSGGSAVEVAFWLVTAGAAVLVFGIVFSRV